jgi:hypothetical protein
MGSTFKGKRGSIPGMGKVFLADPPTLIFQGYSGFFPSENSDRDAKLTNYAYKLQRLRVQLHRPPLIRRLHSLPTEFRTLM